MKKQNPEIVIFSIFEEIERRTKPSEKKELLKRCRDIDEDILNKIVYYVYDPHVKFYVAERTLKKIKPGSEYKQSFENFCNIANKLQKREIVGKIAFQILQEFFSECDEFAFKWYSRILLKDLRMGVGLAIMKNALNYKEKTFPRPMKGVFIGDISDNLKEKLFTNYEWYAEIKIDGFRIMIYLQPKIGFKMYSSNGKRLNYLEEIFKSVFDPICKSIKHEFILDGELFAGNWSKTMSFGVGRKEKLSKADEEKIKIYLFDLIPCNNPEKIGRTKHAVNIPYTDRKSKLNEFMSKYKTKKFIFVKGTKLSHEELLSRKLYDYCEKAIKAGFEGLMLKRADSPYTFNYKSHLWVKIKKFETIDLLCVDVIPSDKRKGEIAAIVVLYKGERVRVSGMTEEDRKRFFKDPNLVVGKIVEVKYLPILTGDKKKLRHPVFIRIREDKTKPDA